MTNQITLIEELSGLEILEKRIRELEPEKSYLMATAIAKMAEKVKSDSKDDFTAYYDKFKELPAGFSCKESERVSYAFEEDELWNQYSGLIKAREEEIKAACKAQDKNQTYADKNGEVVNPVTRKYQHIYSVTR